VTKRNEQPAWTHGSALAPEPAYDPKPAELAPNTRAREEDMPQIALLWIGYVEWHTYKSAHAIVHREWGVTYDRLYHWVRARPEYETALKAAVGLRVARLEKRLAMAKTLPPDERVAEERVCQWELGKVAREDYGDRSKVENEVTVKPALSDDTPEKLADDFIATVGEDQILAALARRKGGE
jgi:hypothetical protein